MAMNGSTVETGVDELLKLVKQRQKISVAEASRILKVPESAVQSWVDFLIEEEILGVEYKFITPYIYINEHSSHKLQRQNKDTLLLKEEFFEKAKRRNLPAGRINILWKQYVQENLISIKQEFVQKAQSKGLGQQKIEALWNTYKMQLLQSQ
ncbi:MAG: hypothetical protein ACOCWQ_02935 [Nanoarchaeota archaeon]